jgi:hypothetical protein
MCTFEVKTPKWYKVALPTIVVELLAIMSGLKNPIGIYLLFIEDVLGTSR